MFFFSFGWTEQSLPQTAKTSKTPKTPKNSVSDVDAGSNSSSLDTVDDSGSESDNSLVFQVNSIQ